MLPNNFRVQRFSFFLAVSWLQLCTAASAQTLVCEFPSRAFQTEYSSTNGVVRENLNRDAVPDLAVFAPDDLADTRSLDQSTTDL